MGSHHIAAVAVLGGASPTRKAVLFALATAVDIDGHWQLDRHRLCHMAGVSERTLRDHLNQLTKAGVVSIDGRERLTLSLPA